MNRFIFSNVQLKIKPQYKQLGYSVRRSFVDDFFLRHVSSMPKKSRVLDLGGHKTGKRGQFDIGLYDLNVVYANLMTNKQPDIQANAMYIPFNESVFDGVICAELLEHVFDPLSVLHEAYRVLHTEGIFLITVPFLYHIHGDPYDFGRYTDHFWLRGLQQIGFKHIVIEKQGLFFSVMIDFLKQYVGYISHRPYRRIVSQVVLTLQHLAFSYEQLPHIKNDLFLSSFTGGFGIVATK